jgi:isopentenyldiphosphate isomerase
VCVVDELVERVDDQDRVLGMVVGRRQAIREGWLHRIAVTVCRDERGRILVHRRSEQVSRFPGLYEVEVGGAANVGESYEQAAARELAEELGIRALPRLLFTFINRSGLSPHWLGVHEAVVPDAVVPDPDEVAWYGWLTEPELRSALLEWRFTPDSNEAFSRYLAFRTGRRPALRPGSPTGPASKSCAGTGRRSSPKALPQAPRRPSRSRTGGTSGTT